MEFLKVWSRYSWRILKYTASKHTGYLDNLIGTSLSVLRSSKLIEVNKFHDFVMIIRLWHFKEKQFPTSNILLCVLKQISRKWMLICDYFEGKPRTNPSFSPHEGFEGVFCNHCRWPMNQFTFYKPTKMDFVSVRLFCTCRQVFFNHWSPNIFINGGILWYMSPL